MVTSDDYIYHSFEIQINDAGKGIHQTAAVYDAREPSGVSPRPAGEWNHLKVIFRGRRLQVELNEEQAVDWQAEPRGKVKDFAEQGYIGLQNHDSHTSVRFKNIFVMEL
jgi:hypothetical protein